MLKYCFTKGKSIASAHTSKITKYSFPCKLLKVRKILGPCASFLTNRRDWVFYVSSPAQWAFECNGERHLFRFPLTKESNLRIRHAFRWRPPKKPILCESCVAYIGSGLNHKILRHLEVNGWNALCILVCCPTNKIKDLESNLEVS